MFTFGSAVRPPPIRGVDWARAIGAVDVIVIIAIRTPAIQRRICTLHRSGLVSVLQRLGNEFPSDRRGQGQGQSFESTHLCGNTDLGTSTFAERDLTLTLRGTVAAGANTLRWQVCSRSANRTNPVRTYGAGVADFAAGGGRGRGTRLALSERHVDSCPRRLRLKVLGSLRRT